MRVAKLLGFGTDPPKPVKARARVIVPVTVVSLLVERGVGGFVARSGGHLCDRRVRRRRR